MPIAQDVNSESWSYNGLQGVEVEHPTQTKQGTVATWKRPETPGDAMVHLLTFLYLYKYRYVRRDCRGVQA